MSAKYCISLGTSYHSKQTNKQKNAFIHTEHQQLWSNNRKTRCMIGSRSSDCKITQVKPIKDS